MARREPKHFGVLLIDKPAGPTSHDVVGWVRWALRERAVGHCGTLDPAATGLLVVCVGEATKLVEHFSGVDKRYAARFVLGRSTTTADGEGETRERAPVPAELGAQAAEALAGLSGALELPPPAFSAVKVDGKRAHELARAGEELELARRPMTVHRVVVGEQGHDPEDQTLWIEAELDVTKGTYVRSLAEELGRRLGLPAHLGTLRRLACADLRVDDRRAVTGLGARELPPLEGRPPRWRVEAPSAVGEGREAAGDLLRAKLDPPWARLPFPCFALNEAGSPEFARLLQGQRLGLDPAMRARLGLEPGSGICALIDRAGGHMVLARRDQDRAGRPRLAPSRVLRFPIQDPKKPA